MDKIPLEREISMHPWNGWNEDGRGSGDTNSVQTLVKWGAAYARNNATKQVYRIRRDIKSKPFDLDPIRPEQIEWKALIR
jgi:hypothetical protein